MNNFEKKLNELIDLLKEQEEVKRFIAIEKELKENDFIRNKIESFKKFQKKMVIYEHHNSQIPDETNNEYDLLYQELLDIPIFNEYIALRQELNDVIQQITEIIESEINK